ncbi:MAG: branched-chain amino acid ABC transporter permease [Oscillospiraceae bacterium]|nr:branched-chain amino acid ABC transporter permease [Oscillospiraceae bacterium]MBR2366682.1 branched-chain amino acid ABC transporter permease [Oscillospiraceae bacterium]MBR2897814.1 branched-chain amino acid ABC transporter permease [Oscillospiraceae bacterium]MBR2977963.1 branched-chain amino acid ABC transporter permease [Oscillospiraceae bacterium]MBR3849887.1 branched-chain amino acid ABC transporter permease [Oscillospiraceae bacterium]
MKTLSKNTKNNLLTYALVIVAYVVLQSMQAAGALSRSFSGQLVPICVYISLAISLNLVVGVSGELSLGHAGFMSVGAFSGVIVAVCLKNAVANDVLRLICGMLGGAAVAAFAGFLIGIPVLRLRGDYLAIVTLAFGEIIKNVVNILYVGVDAKGLHVSTVSTDALGLVDGTVIMNGPMGATGVPQLSSFFMGFVLIMVTLFIVLSIIGSRQGRAIMAARDNRIAAESVGISVSRCKLTAFVISAALAGMAGALYAMNYSTVAAKKFDFNTSILVLVFVVLGGMGNIRGGIIAAAVLTVLPELLRSMQDYRMLVYAIVLILVMLGRNNATLKNNLSRLVKPLTGLFRKGAAANGKEGD